MLTASEFWARPVLLDQVMCDHLAGMVGFRNILLHEYTQLDLDLMIDAIENHLDDLVAFAQQIVLLFSDAE